MVGFGSGEGKGPWWSALTPEKCGGSLYREIGRFDPIEYLKPLEDGQGAGKKGLPNPVPGEFLTLEDHHFPTEFSETEGRDTSGGTPTHDCYWFVQNFSHAV